MNPSTIFFGVWYSLRNAISFQYVYILQISWHPHTKLFIVHKSKSSYQLKWTSLTNLEFSSGVIKEKESHINLFLWEITFEFIDKNNNYETIQSCKWVSFDLVIAFRQVLQFVIWTYFGSEKYFLSKLFSKKVKYYNIL